MKKRLKDNNTDDWSSEVTFLESILNVLAFTSKNAHHSWWAFDKVTISNTFVVLAFEPSWTGWTNKTLSSSWTRSASWRKTVSISTNTSWATSWLWNFNAFAILAICVYWTSHSSTTWSISNASWSINTGITCRTSNKSTIRSFYWLLDTTLSSLTDKARLTKN